MDINNIGIAVDIIPTPRPAIIVVAGPVSDCLTIERTGDFPVAEKVANQCLSLPMSPYLSQEDQAKVIDAICT